MNSKKNNIMLIQNKFYESLKQKEIMYKQLEEDNKMNKEENNINLEFNYPYYIYQEIKKKEKEEKNLFPYMNHDEEESDVSEDKKDGEKINKNFKLWYFIIGFFICIK